MAWQSAAFSEKTIEKVAVVLIRKLHDLEGKLKDLSDERISEWEKGQEFEKIELRERIQMLEERQVKILARYEQMRQTLSKVSEQVFNLKQKLRYHKTEAISNMAKVLAFESAQIPLDVDHMREMVVALKIENKRLTAKLPIDEPKEEGGEKEGGRKKKEGKAAATAAAEAIMPVAAGQNLIRDGDVIVAGTKMQLMACLLSKVNADTTFSVDFLCVYPCFLSGNVLLQNIIQRFTSSTDKSQQLRVFNVMKTWVNCNYLDFRDDASLRESALDFIPTMADVVSERQTQMLISVLEKKVNSVESEPKTYLIPKSKEWNLLKLDSAEIARQMTLHDSKLYRLIDPRMAMKNPEELLMTKRMRKIEGWVERELKKSKKKPVTIKKFIEIILHCFRLRNLFSTFVLIDAVGATSDENRKLISKGYSFSSSNNFFCFWK